MQRSRSIRTTRRRCSTAPMRCSAPGATRSRIAGFDRLLALVPRHAEALSSRGPGAAGARAASGCARELCQGDRAREGLRRCAFQPGAGAADRRRVSRAASPNTNGAGSAPASRGAASASRSGSANIRSDARRSCCMPSRGWATRSSSPAMRRCWRRAARRCCSKCRRELKTAARGLEGVQRARARRSAAGVRRALSARQPAARVQDHARRPCRPAIPYLRASEERIAKWRPRLEALPGKRVALAWAGNPDHINDRNRSIALARLAPLLSTPGVSFVGIQRDVREERPRAARQRRSRISARSLRTSGHRGGDRAVRSRHHGRYLGRASGRRDRAAALGAAAVLAGLALDARCATRSPWYPDARLFRQGAGRRLGCR